MEAIKHVNVMRMSYTGINTFLYVDTCVYPHLESQQCNCALCEFIKKGPLYCPVFLILNSVLITPTSSLPLCCILLCYMDCLSRRICSPRC